MVKRKTIYKQVYLIDSIGLKCIDNQNQNLQNSVSHKVSLSIPNINDNPNYPLQEQNAFISKDQEKIENNTQAEHENNKDDLLRHYTEKKGDTKIHTKTLLQNDDDDTVSLPESFSYQSDNKDDSFRFRKEVTNERNQSTIPRFVNISDGKLKRKSNKVFTCNFCKRQFGKKFLLKKHMYYHRHVNNNNTNNQQNGNDSIQQPQIPSADDDDWIDVPDQIHTTNDNNVNSPYSSTVVRTDTQTRFSDPRNIMDDNVEPQKLTSYICAKCGQQFRNYESANRHQIQTHGTVGALKRSITNSNMKGVIGSNKQVEEIQSYWCSACGSFLQNFDSLQRHLKEKHTNAPIRAKRSKTNDKIKRSRVLYYTKW